MVIHEIKRGKKREEVDQRHHLKRDESELFLDQLNRFDNSTVSMINNLFRPQVDQHIELLSMAQSDKETEAIMLHLQRSYGNQYVQRLVKLTQLQAQPAVNPRKDTHENGADTIVDIANQAPSSELQFQMGKEEMQTKLLRERQDVDQEQADRHFQSDNNQKTDLLKEQPIGKTSNSLPVIQGAWLPQQVREVLKRGAAGVRATLVRAGFNIFKYDTLRIRKKVGIQESEGDVHGFADKNCNMIGIWAGETPESAAATIVHEAQHVQQAEEEAIKAREKLDVLTKEYEAHIREEQFRKEHGQPPKKPEFRDEHGEIDVPAIKRWVDENYGKGSVRRYYPSGHAKEGQPISLEDLKHLHNLAENLTQVDIWPVE